MGKIQMDPGIFANWNFVSLIKLLYGKFFVEVTWLLRSSKLCLISPNNIQGISYWSVKSNSALMGRRINYFIEIWFVVGLGGLEIWVSSIGV